MLEKIMLWCDKNKVTVNIKKTICMLINSGSETTDRWLTIKGVDLEMVKHFEYLGMHVYNKLLMNKHVESMIKKSRCKLGILYELRKFISSDIALLIHKVKSRPHMEYRHFVVESANQLNIERLERLQEKCLHLTEY